MRPPKSETRLLLQMSLPSEASTQASAPFRSRQYTRSPSTVGVQLGSPMPTLVAQIGLPLFTSRAMSMQSPAFPPLRPRPFVAWPRLPAARLGAGAEELYFESVLPTTPIV